MQTLILMLSLLGGQADSACLRPAVEQGQHLWRQRGATWQAVADSVASLRSGEPNYVTEWAFFGPQEPVVENVELPAFVFSTVTSTVQVADEQGLIYPVTPRIIIQEEEEEKLGLVIPEETVKRR